MRTYVWDIECTNLRSDIGTLLIATFGELNAAGKIKKLETRDIMEMHSAGQQDGELNLARWVSGMVTGGDIFIGHNSIAFDRNYLNGILARVGEPPLPKRHHIDTMLTVKGRFQYQSISLDNLADVLDLAEQKDKPPKSEWREANLLDREALDRLRKRCESDVRVTAQLWNKVKPWWHERHGR